MSEQGGATTAPRTCRAGAYALGAALWCAAAVVAWPQTIKIPDFRQQPPPVSTFKPGEACIECGRIMSIREVQSERRPAVPQGFGATAQPGPPTGPAGTNLVGAVIYLPLGDSAEKPYVGGVGTPEMRERFRDTTYEITVRLDDGAMRFLQRHDGTRYRVGDRVRVSGVGHLELLVE